MMAENIEDTNHDSTFEIINTNNDVHAATNEAVPPAPTAFSTLPPPAALPAFAAFGAPTITAVTPPIPPTPPSSQTFAPPKPPESNVPSTGGNPFSIRAAGTSGHQHHVAMPPVQMPPAPTVMMPTPLPPLMEGPTRPDFAARQQSASGGVEIPFDILSHGSTLTGNTAEHTGQQQGGGVWGWVRGAVHSSPLLTKVAETAKSSVDSVIATLDPQMKEYMGNRSILDVVITLDRDEEIRGIKEGITRVFPASNIRPFVVAAGLHSATQPVGFGSGLYAAQQKVAYIRSSGYVEPHSLVIGNEGFIVESSPDTWLYMDCVVLDDASRQIQVQAFTQPVQIPREIVQALKEQTREDYPFKESGYAVSVSHAMTHFWSLAPLEWQERVSGISRIELLKNAALALAYSYRAKL